jgi:hypothetical protein
VATKKTSGTGTRSRTKKAVTNPEVMESAVTNPGTTTNATPTPSPATTPNATSTPTTGSGGTAVALAREKAPATKTSTPAANTAKPNFNHPAAERIRQRAYELFQKRGGQHGFDIEDWLRAEAELTPR